MQTTSKTVKPDTGDKVEFNTVDFVEVDKVDRVALAPNTLATVDRIGNKVDRVGENMHREKLLIQVVADLSP